MMKSIVLFMIATMTISVSATPALQVVNLETAQSALRTGAFFVQDREVRTPWHLDYSRPYCMTLGFHFEIKPGVIYPITRAEVRKNSKATWEINLRMDTHENPEEHRFWMSCFTNHESSLEDVRMALSGVYEVIETGL
jgi:hypothetical protein